MTDYRGYPGFRQNKLETEIDRHIENLSILGYSVMENVISRDEAKVIESKIVKLYAEQEQEFGKARLQQLNEYEVHRGLLEADPSFAEMVANPKVLEVIYAILGDTAILNLQNATTAFPRSKHFQSSFHRDLAKDYVSDRALAINAFWCVSDFFPENGATWVTPVSHRSSTLPSPEFIEKNSLQVCAPAGSVIFWDSLLLHKAGYNKTDNPRYGINHMYTKPFLKQQIDFPVYLKDKYPIESKIGQLLGFWSIPPKSVKEFRVDPDKRTYRRNQG